MSKEIKIARLVKLQSATWSDNSTWKDCTHKDGDPRLPQNGFCPVHNKEMLFEFSGDVVNVIHSNCQDQVDKILTGAKLVQHSFCG